MPLISNKEYCIKHDIATSHAVRTAKLEEKANQQVANALEGALHTTRIRDADRNRCTDERLSYGLHHPGLEALLQGCKADHPYTYCPHFPVATVEDEVTSPTAFRDRCYQKNGLWNGIKVGAGWVARPCDGRERVQNHAVTLATVTAAIPFLVKKISNFEQRPDKGEELKHRHRHLHEGPRARLLRC